MPYGPRGQGRASRKHAARTNRQQRRLAKDLQAMEAAPGATPFTLAEVTADYTMLQTDGYVELGAATAADRTITLHADPDFQVLYFKNSATDPSVDMRLNPDSTILIDGAAEYVLAPGAKGLVVVWNGTAYKVVANF